MAVKTNRSKKVARSAPALLRETPGWTFLTNHTHVLVCLARDPEVRVREVALAVGITERAVLRIISELVADGVLTVTKEGRRNRYRLSRRHPLRHPMESSHTVGDLLKAIA